MLYGAQSYFEVRGGKPTFTCEDRHTSLETLAADKAAALLSQAKLFDVYWVRVPHTLARDTTGVYYYVDRLVDDERSGGVKRGFRVFRGMRGALRQLRMKNVVSDVKGEIFTTNRGQLRLVPERSGAGDSGALWIAGKRNVKLVALPVSNPQTRVMIYRELGVYSGLRLQRPCDDW